MTIFTTRNLRQRLYKESYEFVKQQRIECLMQGAWFPISFSRSNATSGSPYSPGSSQTTDINSPNSLSSTNTPALMNPSVLIGGSAGHAMTAATAGIPTHTGYRWRYYKLSPSKKQLHYGDFAERIPTRFKGYEKLTEKSKLCSTSELPISFVLSNTVCSFIS